LIVRELRLSELSVCQRRVVDVEVGSVTRIFSAHKVYADRLSAELGHVERDLLIVGISARILVAEGLSVPITSRIEGFQDSRTVARANLDVQFVPPLVFAAVVVPRAASPKLLEHVTSVNCWHKLLEVSRPQRNSKHLNENRQPNINKGEPSPELPFLVAKIFSGCKRCEPDEEH
jgi:hypothetical protein